MSSRLADLSPEKRALLEELIRRKQGGDPGAVAPEASRPEGAAAGGIPVAGRVSSGLPLSFAQERLWFLDRLYPGTATYNVPLPLAVRGGLRVPVLARVLGEIVRRHEVLRTTFAEGSGGIPVQVASAPFVTLPEVDLSGLAPEIRGVEARRLTAAECRRPFDLARGPLLRCTVLRLVPEVEHAVLFTLHHIVADLGSMRVLIAEIGALYPAFAAGLPSPLFPLPVQYADFAVWQRGWLQGEVLEEQLRFWRERLAGAPEALELPLDRPRPAVPSGRGDIQVTRIGPRRTAAIAALGPLSGGTLSMVLLASWAALLQRTTGQIDLLTGLAVANRTRPELEKLIGFFTNTLVLRVDSSGDPSFLELAGRVREMALAAYAHQDLPFEKLVEELAPERSLAHTPLFQVMYSMLDTAAGGGGARLDLPGLALSQLPVEANVTKFDLTLAADRSDAGLSLGLDYSSDLFDPPTVARLLEHLVVLLGAAAIDPQRPVGDLPLLAAAERHQLLAEWGEGSPAAPSGVRAHRLFTVQAAATPERTAVLWQGGELSYAGLRRRVTGLARHLLALGLGPEGRVGVCLERGWEMVASLLAVLEAGGCFLPLDPAYPPERLAFMVENAGVQLLITRAGLAGSLPAAGARVVLWDDDKWEGLLGGPDVLFPIPDAEALAYLIYTSGSTGRPKGVAMPHRVLANLALWQIAGSVLPAGSPARTLQFASPSFDVFFQETLASLGSGGTLVLVPEEHRRDPTRLLAWLREARVERLFLPFVALQHLAEAAAEEERDGAAGAQPLRLREVVTAGEQLRITPEIVSLFQRLPGCVLDNHYGPSETHLATAFRLDGDPGDWPALPSIGRPIAGFSLHLLDRGMVRSPMDGLGEIYLGGAGVARGYLGRPEATAEKFLPDPWSPTPGGRLYRSGDLARYRPTGRLEFLGRADQQVKIRGFRVEPGEIEAALETHPAVREAVVGVQEGGGARRLVAWVLPGASSLSPGDLRSYLRERLPDYMVPSFFVPVEAFPLTPSGKVDRRRLAELDAGSDEGSGEPTAAPRTPVEEILAGIWTELLEGGAPEPGREAYGPEDDFFDRGGHSLLVARAVSRMRGVFGIELPLRVLFEQTTLSGWAAAVEEQMREGRTAAPPIAPVPRAGLSLPLSFAQERLWFFDRMVPVSHAYNLPFAVRLLGSLDREALAAALSQVVARHEALRTTFAPSGSAGQATQRVAPPPSRVSPLPYIDLSALDDPESEAARLAAAEAGRPFDLERGPLLRCYLVRRGAEDHLALFTLHHIVADGWSLAVLTRELGELYGAAVTGRAVKLAALPVQYADFAVWQREWLSGEILETQLAYWRDRLAGAPAALELPLDRPRPSVQSFRGAAHGWSLPAAAGIRLRALCRSEGATPFMAILAAFGALLGRLAGQEDVVLGSPVAGRDRAETEGLIGFFVNTLALRLDLSGDPTSAELVRRAREAALGAYAHQDLPFEALVEELHPERDLSRSPIFQVVLAWQSTPDVALDLPGVTLRPVEVVSTSAKLDLVLALSEEAGHALAGAFERSTDLFDATTVVRLGEQLARLLEGMTAAPQAPVRDLPILSASESHQISSEWNDTARPEPLGFCLHELFAAHAVAAPAAPALVFGGRVISYGELAARAARLARRLRSLGVGPETPVALCAGRSPDLTTAVLAVLQAGGVYVPLDPAHPPERLAFVIEDSGAALVLAEERWIGSLSGAGVRILVLETAIEEADTWPAIPPMAEDGLPDRLACILYTSGSTGRPKGVGVTHRAIVGMACHSGVVTLDASDRVAHAANPAFDAAACEIWSALLHGACLVGIERDALLSPAVLAARLAAERITLLLLTPALFHQVARETPRAFGGLRWFLTGGDAADPRWVREVLASGAPPQRLLHVYGPTEATVYVTSHQAAEVALGALSVPIGRPIDHVRLRVLDAELRPVPVGVAGDLYIGGPSLARGYTCRPDLTAERFVPDPLGTGRPGERLYRTGDRARYLANGELEFLGRHDRQVKVRGFRIELGEVEAALAEHPAVAEAAVVVRGGGADKVLVAWIAGQGEPPAPAELRRALERKLPAAMMPSAIGILPALPLTPNGKVDRAALSRMEVPGAAGVGERGEDFVPPRTPVEEVLAGIWMEILGLDPARTRIGSGDNFFELSGHSLLAMQVSFRIQEVFGVELPLRLLFERPTLAELSFEIESAAAAGSPAALPPIEPVPRDEPLPASFYQEWGWHLERQVSGPSNGVPLGVRWYGDLDMPTLRRSLDEIVGRHEPLRTTFYEAEGLVLQAISPPAEVPLPEVDLGALPADRSQALVLELAAEHAGHLFDLERGPLLTAQVVHLGDQHVLLCNLHHSVFDGWSVGIFRLELSLLYAAFLAGEPSPLPPLELQFADFSAWQRRVYAHEALAEELDWWHQQLAGLPPVLELPADRPRPEILPNRRGVVSLLSFGPGLTKGLRALARSASCSLAMVLTAGIEVLLFRYTGCEDLLLNSSFAGRDRPELSGVIGLFMNTVVIRTDLSGRPTFRELLLRVRESVLAAYAHQHAPFPKVLEALFPGRRTHRAMVSRVILNFMSMAEQPLGEVRQRTEMLEGEYENAKQDLTFACQEHGDNLHCAVIGSPDLFEPESVAELAADFEALLAQAAADSESPIDRLLPVFRLRAVSAALADAGVG